MKLIRKIKINKITPVKFTKKEKEIIELINYWTVGLEKVNYIDDDYNTFFYKDGKIFLMTEKNNYKARFRYDSFLEILLHKVKLSKKKVITLLEDILINILKVKYNNIVDLTEPYVIYAETKYELSKKI